MTQEEKQKLMLNHELEMMRMEHQQKLNEVVMINKEPWYLKIGRHLTNWINSGGIITICIIAVFGIAFAVIGHYGTLGFNWKWFVAFELPLYIFCTWAIVKLVLLVRQIEKRK